VRARPVRQGFTLVEVMVAVLLLSMIALALTQTLVSAQRAHGVSEEWMQATQLAAEGIEQFRAGNALTPLAAAGCFERSGTIALWDDHPGLYRLEVTVSWNNGQSHFQLITLARR
jgi:prepilin-type N-terminal cleavage/methylation domain-containing protein